jgi:tRNA U34 2-thiouridine synthase MnmA/TrmU
VGPDVVGLQMSNWNALDKDAAPATNGAAATTGRKQPRQHGATMAPSSRPRAAALSGGAFCEASETDYRNARAVAQHLSMPLHHKSFISEYWMQVFKPFVGGLAFSDATCDTGPNSGSQGKKRGAANGKAPRCRSCPI